MTLSDMGFTAQFINKLLSSQTLWIALGSLGTFLMAIATFKSLSHYKKREQKKIKEELLENILIPSVKELEKIISCLRELDLPHTLSTKWGYKENGSGIWAKIKEEKPHLVYDLNKKLRERIENFYQDFGQLVYLFNQHIKQISNFIIEEAQYKIIDDPYDRHIGPTRHLLYNLAIGGKLFSASFYGLIFEDMTLDNYINNIKNTEQLPNKQVRKIEFMVDGIGRKELTDKDFMKLDSKIKQRISGSEDVKKFIAECRKFYKRATELKNELEKTIAKYRK